MIDTFEDEVNVDEVNSFNVFGSASSLGKDSRHVGNALKMKMDENTVQNDKQLPK